MKIMTNKHLRTKFIIYNTVLVAIIALFMLMFFPGNLKHEKFKSIKEKATSIAELTSFSVSPGLYFEDLKSIEEALGGIKHNKDLTYLLIAKNNGNIIYEFNKANAMQAEYLNDNEFSQDESTLKIKSDIVYNGKKLGSLYLGISLESLSSYENSTIFSIAVLSVVVFIVGFIVVIFVSFITTRPINEMVRTIEGIKAKDWSQRVNVSTNDEIGKLGIAFNQLLDELEIAYGNLTKANTELQETIVTQKELIVVKEELADSLSKSEKKYRFLADNVVDLIWTTDTDLNMTYITPSVEPILGFTVEEWLRFKPKDYFTPESYLVARNIYNEELNRIRDTGNVNPKPVVFESELMKKNGSTLWVENTVKIFTDEDKALSGIFFFSRDISERKEAEAQKRLLEEQLTQTQKMESLGRLSGGIAHDLNNMLTPILGYAEILRLKLTEDESLYNRVQKIIGAANNARDLIKQLLAFARKQTLLIKPTNLNDVINDFNPMLARTLKANISINYKLNKNLSLINADVIQIQQILINLCVNSQDAMPEGGKITIETDNVYIDKYYPFEHEGIANGKYIVLTIKDSGVGMDRATQSKVFEPFFTTKGPGKGTGLGLATVYGIIKQQKGHIWLYSELGKGTVFKIHFPAIESDFIAAKLTEAEVRDITGDETLLVVEDQKSVLDMVTEYLNMNGYRVIVARDGNSAINQFMQHLNSVQLIITDVVLPDINGKQVYDSLLQLNPYLRVLYMSGYSEDIITVENVLKPGVNFIQKPFNLKDLGRKIRDILDSRKA